METIGVIIGIALIIFLFALIFVFCVAFIWIWRIMRQVMKDDKVQPMHLRPFNPRK